MPQPVTRRAALGALAATGAATALAGSARAQQRRPNVVFILIDDLRWDALSCLGHPFLQTPHLDRLAAEGALFPNAFVNISLCSPSRACFLSGCEPQRAGVRTNEQDDLDPRLETFATRLQSAGYETAWVGKWHQKPDPNPRRGFDYWLSFRGQGEYVDPQLNENGRDFKATGYMTDLLTDYAVAFLQRERTRPFCLTLSHKAVHGPFTPAERHRGTIANYALPKPPNADDDLSGKPWWQRAALVRGGRTEQYEQNRDKPVPDAMPPREWNDQAHRGYFEALLAVDESVGRVLGTLQELGVLDDTLVIFTSDNGYFHGEHRRGDKRLAYEESLRVPLLARYPRLIKPGSRPTPMVLNLDICPTICEVCGVAPPEALAGRSLKPLLQQPDRRPADWRDAFLYQYFQEGWLKSIPDIQAVRTERYKYIRSPEFDDARELYDLQTDPHELRNLAADPAHAAVRAELERRLEAFLAAAEASRLPPSPPPPAPESKLLHRFVPGPDAPLVDTIGGLTGAVKGVGRGTVDGREALLFDGRATIEFDPRTSPPLHGRPFYVTLTCRAEADGVILSHGGQTNGWSLAVVDGRPVFSTRSGGSLATITGAGSILGRWVTISARATNDRRLTLAVDGRPAADPVPGRPPAALPNEGLTLGADLGTKVATIPASGFVGALAELLLGQGEPD